MWSGLYQFRSVNTFNSCVYFYLIYRFWEVFYYFKLSFCWIRKLRWLLFSSKTVNRHKIQWFGFQFVILRHFTIFCLVLIEWAKDLHNIRFKHRPHNFYHLRQFRVTLKIRIIPWSLKWKALMPICINLWTILRFIYIKFIKPIIFFFWYGMCILLSFIYIINLRWTDTYI